MSLIGYLKRADRQGFGSALQLGTGARARRRGVLVTQTVKHLDSSRGGVSLYLSKPNTYCTIETAVVNMWGWGKLPMSDSS